MNELKNQWDIDVLVRARLLVLFYRSQSVLVYFHSMHSECSGTFINCHQSIFLPSHQGVTELL